MAQLLVRSTTLLLALLLVAGAAAHSPRALPETLDPWCAALSANDAPGAPLPAQMDPPLFHVDRALLADGRIRVQIDALSIESVRRQAETEIVSLAWERSCGELGQATIAIADLPRLAALPGIVSVMRPPTGVPMATVSAGVAEIGADLYQRDGYDGSGVTIGILDIGFDGIESLRGSELPGDIKMQSFVGDGSLANLAGIPPTAHGTACAEIIHDVAPGAKLVVANAATVSDMEAAINWMRDEGVSIISHSVGWFWGPGDGTGTIVDLANRAIDAEILWVNAAGNQAEAYWGGDFKDSDGDGFCEFNLQDDETITHTNVAVPEDFQLVLTWDAWPSSPGLSFELDLYVDGDRVASSEWDVLSPAIYAYRQLIYIAAEVNQSVDISIRRTAGTGPAKLRLFRLDNHAMGEHGTSSGSLAIPADAPRVLSVGAYRRGSLNQPKLEDFSSRGPTQAGLAKPEICALDGVTTLSTDPFYGTSAACPLAAGAAALLHASAPQGGFFDFRWRIDELRNLLAWSAAEAPFIDPNACRWGLLDLPSAAASGRGQAGPRLQVTSPARPPIQARLLDAGPGPLHLMIFDALGRTVHAEEIRSTHLPQWNGQSGRGRALPSGMYLMTVRGDQWTTSRPVMLLR